MSVDIAVGVLTGARWLAAAMAALAGIVALTHWAVRQGTLNAFGPWPRFVRSWSDPVLRPVERRIVRAGGNPQTAVWWLLGLAVLGGLALVAVVRWLIQFIGSLQYAAQYSGRALVMLLVYDAISLLMMVIMVRVLASWFGMGRYHKFMRPFYFLTDWLIEPLRRVLPPFGMLDLSPLAAYFALYLVQNMIARGSW